MTPRQEALDALDRDLPRSGLSEAAQLEYDRLKPVWERGVPAEVMQSYLDAAASPWPDLQLASRQVADRPTTTRTLRFAPGWSLACAIFLVGCGIILIGVAVFAPPAPQGGSDIWGRITVIGLVALPCVLLGILSIRRRLQIRSEKLYIRSLLRTRTVSFSEIREITLERTGPPRGEPGSPDRIWRARLNLDDGSVIWLHTSRTLPEHKPPPRKMAAIVDEIRAFLAIH